MKNKSIYLSIAATVFASGLAMAQPDPRNLNATNFETFGGSQTIDVAVPDGAIIDNGTIQLGVRELGNLDVGGGTPSSGTGTRNVGLRYMPTNADATAPGCLCEGWGVADNLTKVTGFANVAGGTSNVTLESFAETPSTAISVVTIGSTFRVTHDYVPSASPNLYLVKVTIENISDASTEVLYRRVFDFDIEPTAFSEYITINTAGSPAIIFTSNNGFATSNPLAGPSDIGGVTGDFVDSGPRDHGALFDFNFGTLAPGATTTFSTYYGAAGDERGMLTALAAVGAEAFSLGQPSSSDPKEGTPNTFAFAFSGVGGRVFVLHDYFGVALVNNINGNGSQEIAALTTLKNGTPVVVIKDSRTKQTLRIRTFLSKNFEPIAIDSNGINIVVLARNRANGQIWAQARNANTGALLWSVTGVQFPRFN